MILKFKVSNFLSIGEEQVLDFTVNNKNNVDNSCYQVKDKKNINLVNCFVGANASGKSTILKAIDWLFYSVNYSYEHEINESEFKVNKHRLYKKKNTKFELEFFSDKTFYRYRLHTSSKSFLFEELSVKEISKSKYRRLFRVDRSSKDKVVDTALSINKTDLERFLDRKCTSFLSMVISLKYYTLNFFKKYIVDIKYSNKLKLDISFAKWIRNSKRLLSNKKLKKPLINFLNSTDICISDIYLEEIQIQSSESEQSMIKIENAIHCKHKTTEKEFSLPLIEESHGTQKAIDIFLDFYPLLSEGGVVVYDELSTGIHPFVAKVIVSLFTNKDINKENAQLIFSTHQHMLLKDRQKSQIFLCEKESNILESEIYRLDEIEDVRSDENYFNKYLAGVYGAVPDVDYNLGNTFV